jgi:antirestriction protein ArdC
MLLPAAHISFQLRGSLTSEVFRVFRGCGLQLTIVHVNHPLRVLFGDCPHLVGAGSDWLHMPEKTRFASVEEYYSTLFHELSHSTGHSSRLDRKLDTDPKPFGSPDYGKEELVAEMSAAFLCSHAGIQPAVIGNQAAYLAGWLKQIKSDKKLVISAAGQAQRAADWIRGERGPLD